MTKQTKTLIAIGLILSGILSIITTGINLQVVLTQTEAILSGQVTDLLSPVISWGLDIIMVVGMIYLISSEKFKKTNYFWVLLLPLGLIILAVRQLLRLNKSKVNQVS